MRPKKAAPFIANMKFKLKCFIIPLFFIVALWAFLQKQKTTVHFRPIDDISWRERVDYAVVSSRDELERQKIFSHTIRCMSMEDSMENAYQKCATKFHLDISDIKNIIGEGIARDWPNNDNISITKDTALANQNN